MCDFAKKLEDDEDASHWDGDSDEILAVGDESKQFNADIDAWLPRLHAKQPILFVARHEDGEAGGTKLSAWHKASVAQFAAIEPKILAAIAKKKLKADDLRKPPIQIAASYATKVSPAIKKSVGSDD